MWSGNETRLSRLSKESPGVATFGEVVEPGGEAAPRRRTEPPQGTPRPRTASEATCQHDAVEVSHPRG